MKHEKENELIAEGSEILAQFMNGEHREDGETYFVITKNDVRKFAPNDVHVIRTGFKYHKSWNWLMPVVQRIKNRTSVEDFNYHANLMTEYRDRKSTVMDMKVTQDILVVFIRCVEFVKWYSSSAGAINSFSSARK